MAEKVSEKRIITPKFRVSFPNVFKPDDYNGQSKYNISMIFEAGTDLTAMKKAASAAAIEKFGAEGVAKLNKVGKLKSPFHSGEEKDCDGYDDDCTWVNASTKIKPDIVGPDGKTRIEIESDFYGGCYARATLVCYAYDNEGKGVAFGLRNLQKIADGEPFAGSNDATQDFDAVEGYESAASSDDDGEEPIF